MTKAQHCAEERGSQWISTFPSLRTVTSNVEIWVKSTETKDNRNDNDLGGSAHTLTSQNVLDSSKWCWKELENEIHLLGAAVNTYGRCDKQPQQQHPCSNSGLGTSAWALQSWINPKHSSLTGRPQLVQYITSDPSSYAILITTLHKYSLPSLV